MEIGLAITKIMYMKAGKAGNVAAHLKHSLEYICNEAKTENRSLVGGITACRIMPTSR